MSKRVRYELDLSRPSQLTAERTAEIEALLACPESEIDFSDIAELGEDFWRNAVGNRYFRPVKQQLTLRLDMDLVAWFKRRAGGKRGYQTGMNRAQRQYVEQQDKKARG